MLYNDMNISPGVIIQALSFWPNPTGGFLKNSPPPICVGDYLLIIESFNSSVPVYITTRVLIPTGHIRNIVVHESNVRFICT